MILSNNRKVIASNGKIFDCRDYSLFFFKFERADTVRITFRASNTGSIKFIWGDGYEEVLQYTTPFELSSLSHSYAAGTYKFSIDSKLNITQIITNRSIDSLGGHYYKLDLDYVSFGNIQYTLSKSQDAVPNYNKVYDDVSVFGNLKIDISKLKLGGKSTRISIPVSPQMSIYGSHLNFIERTNVRTLILQDYSYKGNHNLHEILQYCPNIEVLDIAYYLGADREDISDIIPPSTLQYFRLYTNMRYVGDVSHITSMLNDQLVYFSNSSNTKTRIDMLTGDYSAKTITDINVFGDVSPCSFRFGSKNFQVVFKAATGRLNNILNLPEVNYLTLTCGTESRVTLDISIIGRMNKVNVRIGLTDNSNFYGNISNLYLQNMCTEFAIAGVTGNLITGWKELIDNLYDARSTFKTAFKIFRCPDNMKNALTGIYQTPTGFTKDSTDGNPTSSREKIYVLVNNYNWTFTNI